MSYGYQQRINIRDTEDFAETPNQCVESLIYDKLTELKSRLPKQLQYLTHADLVTLLLADTLGIDYSNLDLDKTLELPQGVNKLFNVRFYKTSDMLTDTVTQDTDLVLNMPREEKMEILRAAVAQNKTMEEFVNDSLKLAAKHLKEEK